MQLTFDVSTLLYGLAVEAQVQGHTSGDSVLVHHPEQLAIYSVATAAREAVWAPHDQSAFREQHVVTATFSADSGHVIAAFSAGNLGIFSGATLQPLQSLALAVLCTKPGDVRPTALAAQPAVPGTDAKPCRLAVGFNDCSVALLEPSGAFSWQAPAPAAAGAQVSPEQQRRQQEPQQPEHQQQQQQQQPPPQQQQQQQPPQQQPQQQLQQQQQQAPPAVDAPTESQQAHAEEAAAPPPAAVPPAEDGVAPDQDDPRTSQTGQ